MPRSTTATVVPLRRAPRTTWRSVELFSGCGGLALGLAEAGFHHELLVERDTHACATLAHNRANKTPHVKHWVVREDDVRAIEWGAFTETVSLVAGGPPCQPFSIGGKAAGMDDERDMWPEAIRAVREIMPPAFVFENVSGLLRPRFADYARWIAAFLSHPRLPRKRGESHLQHLARLERAKSEALYNVQVVEVNAADYGAPQKRKRVLFIGTHRDLAAVPSFPTPTHSQERLVYEKWVSGEYWARVGVAAPTPEPTSRDEQLILARLRKMPLFAPQGLPWMTCREAFAGLGEPSLRQDIPNHKFQAGARAYPGHTGSPIDEPAKALKAGVHGVPGGENMLCREDGSVRYFSIREAARLQGLPDAYEFPGSWTESMRQIGNAVPVHLSRFVGGYLMNIVAGTRRGQAAA